MNVLYNLVNATYTAKVLSLRKPNIPQMHLPSSSQNLAETSIPSIIRLSFSTRGI